MFQKIRPHLFSYGLAVGFFVLVLLISTLLKYFFGSTNLSILVFFFLLVTTWYGGTGPGLLLSFLVIVASILINPKPADAGAAKYIFGQITVSAIVVGFVLLVGSRKRAENALRRQRELLQVTLSSIGDAVIATDAGGKVNFLNPVAETLTGWKQAEAAGMPLDEVFAIADERTGEPLGDSFASIRRDGRAELSERILLFPKNGLTVPVDVCGAAIRDAKGSFVGAVIVFHDVGDRRRAEQEREELLLGAQAARAEAESANRLKDEFLAIVSHELRTPLNAILGWAGMLRMKNLNEAETDTGLRVIERNAVAQNEIISDILDVSRIITGKLRVEPKAVDLVPILRSAVDSVFPAANAKSVAITTSFVDGESVVTGDPVRLRQIFSNLMSNAVKFTPRDGSVSVRLMRVDSQVEVQIKDNGVGISENFLPLVFERFRQGESSIKRTHGGLGLGLAIVQHLTQLHNGTVTVESEGEGKGSVFTVKLPLRSNQPVATAKKPELHDLTGLRILVVDDEPDTLEILCLILERQGAQTHAAPSCAAAMEIFSHWRPDLLISDIGMPGENGFDLIAKIRHLAPGDGGDVPAAALTAYVREEDSLEALAAGFQMHISKPVDPAALVSSIAELADYRSRAPVGSN